MWLSMLLLVPQAPTSRIILSDTPSSTVGNASAKTSEKSIEGIVGIVLGSSVGYKLNGSVAMMSVNCINELLPEMAAYYFC